MSTWIRMWGVLGMGRLQGIPGILVQILVQVLGILLLALALVQVQVQVQVRVKTPGKD